jgi:transposase
MRGQVFQDDGASLHRAAERARKALSAVWITVSSANLYWPANSADLNPIEQMWWMRKGSINREQCNTPEELSVEAQTPVAAISMESVNGMIESYSTRLCAILALRGQCLNWHCSVMRDLRCGVRTPEEIAHARKAQAKSLQRFVKGNRAHSFALNFDSIPIGNSGQGWLD